MDNSPEYIELYLLDKLDPQQMREFELAIEADPRLAELVEQMRQIRTAFEKHGEAPALEAMQRLGSAEELRAVIKQAENSGLRRKQTARMALWSPPAFEKHGEAPALGTMQQQGSAKQFQTEIHQVESSRSPRKKTASIALWGMVAAAATLLIGIFGSQPEYSSKELYNSYFEAQQQFETTPSRGGEIGSPEEAQALSAATKLYRQQDYPAAVRAYSSLWTTVDQEQIPEEAWLYYSLSLIQTDQTDQAIALLRTLSQNDQAELQDQARWTLALALLKANRRDQAMSVLDELTEEQGPLSIQAAVLKIKMTEKRWF